MLQTQFLISQDYRTQIYFSEEIILNFYCIIRNWSNISAYFLLYYSGLEQKLLELPNSCILVIQFGPSKIRHHDKVGVGGD